jgi:SAM-dependent methyltransferase
MTKTNTNVSSVNEQTRIIYHAQHQRIVHDEKAMNRFLNMVQEEYFQLPEGYFKGVKILDAGCGDTAKILIRFHDFGGKDLTGIDLGTEYIDVARANLQKHGVPDADVKLYSGSVDALPFQDESFDFVCCHGVLLHMANIDQATRAFAELARVTRKGGRLYVVGGVYGGLIEHILPGIRDYYQTNSEFKLLIDSVSPETFGDLFEFINIEMSKKNQLGVNMSFIKDMFDVDFCTTLQNLIQAPVRLELSPEFFNTQYTMHGFNTPMRLRRYVMRENIRKYLAPLHFQKDHPLSKILYGEGNLELIAIKMV